MATSTMINMATKVIKNLVLCAAVSAVSLVAMKANPANAASLDFTVTYWGGNWGTGTFEGFDQNSDSFLTKNELTSFDVYSPVENETVNLNNLFGFGSFDLNTGIWNADGAGWQQSTGSYFSWNNGQNSVNPQWATVNYNYVATAVPEPASMLGFLAFGAMGAGSMIKRKQQQKATVEV